SPMTSASARTWPLPPQCFPPMTTSASVAGTSCCCPGWSRKTSKRQRMGETNEGCRCIPRSSSYGFSFRYQTHHPLSDKASTARVASSCRRESIDGMKQEDGAEERTRTSTELPPLAPEASASTNSATSAFRRTGRRRAANFKERPVFCQLSREKKPGQPV